MGKGIGIPAEPFFGEDVEGETVPASTASGLLVGTVDYMAPEQLQRGKLDARTDVFAVGLVLCEMVTGINPFSGHSPTSTIANILKEEPDPPTRKNPRLPADLAAIIQHCLRKHPADRYSSAHALLEDLVHVRDRLQLNLPIAPAPISSITASKIAITRRFARVFFMVIQVGYLVMYALVLLRLHDVLRVSSELYHTYALGFLLLAVATLEIPVRIYFFTAPAFLPLSQRTLMYEAYGSSGGRSSGIRLPTSNSL